MSGRFYAPQPLDVATLCIAGDEAHHLLRVLRLKPGDQVVLFDGRGTEATAEIIATRGTAAEMKVLETRPSTAESPHPIVLATPVPKGDRWSWLVEKATELGVARLIPLLTQRSVVDPGAGKLEKTRRAILEATKQCGRSRLMECDPPMRWAEFIEREFVAGRTLVAHPAGGAGTGPALATAGPIIAAVGPEGGLTNDELQLAVDRGASIVNLGPRILRIETAALALACLLSLPRVGINHDPPPPTELPGR